MQGRIFAWVGGGWGDMKNNALLTKFNFVLEARADV
jgi:hypothetical protein